MARDITIIAHPTSPRHQVAKVTTQRGRVYAVTYAEPFPTIKEVEELWQTRRKAFEPYDETTGRYVA